MPESPDLTVVAEAFDAALRGREIRSAEAPGPLAVRGTPGELAALIGQRIVAIRRRGKFLMIDLDTDAIVVNPMLTGRFQLAAGPAVKHPSKTAVVIGLGSRAEASRPRPPFAPWTRGADWLPPGDGRPEIRYRDPTQMGKVYLLPAGVERPVPGLGAGEIGPDADDPELTLDAWRDRIRRHPGELKNLLRNQSFVAGIGNAYSDEILHAAKLSPFKPSNALSAEEHARLFAANKDELNDAIARSVGRAAKELKGEKKIGLRVHGRTGEPCDVCGTPIAEVAFADSSLQYCPGCQTGGKPLADRRLSKLLK